MGMVGGSRHYEGGGLGPIPVWKCPSCGADNQGPLEQGCALCGAGKPGRHVGREAAPPPPPPLPEIEPAEPPASPNLAVAWLDRHPGATLEEAFMGGYIQGIQEARRAQLAMQPPQPLVFDPDGAPARTIIAALVLFREQVLLGDPEEVTSGEWLNAHQVEGLIRSLQGERVHG